MLVDLALAPPRTLRPAATYLLTAFSKAAKFLSFRSISTLRGYQEESTAITIRQLQDTYERANDAFLRFESKYPDGGDKVLGMARFKNLLRRANEISPPIDKEPPGSTTDVANLGQVTAQRLLGVSQRVPPNSLLAVTVAEQPVLLDQRRHVRHDVGHQSSGGPGRPAPSTRWPRCCSSRSGDDLVVQSIRAHALLYVMHADATPRTHRSTATAGRPHVRVAFVRVQQAAAFAHRRVFSSDAIGCVTTTGWRWVGPRSGRRVRRAAARYGRRPHAQSVHRAHRAATAGVERPCG